MKPTTLCFPIHKDGKLLLGCKKRGFGVGKYNGFGGKIQDNETFRACACRETQEEVALLVEESDLEAVALLDFVFPANPELTHIGYVYFIRKYLGTPLETEEMKPQWFAFSDIPYEKMWKGDATWLPELLEGKKIKGVITFAADNEAVAEMQLTAVESILESEDGNEIKEWLYRTNLSGKGD